MPDAGAVAREKVVRVDEVEGLIWAPNAIAQYSKEY